MTPEEKQLLLICGPSGVGKSASLKDMPNQERGLYLNTESGKALPFRNQFVKKTVTDPWQLEEAFMHVTGNPDFDYIIVDSLTFLMDMYESMHVLTSADSRSAWGDYAQFFKTLMQDWVAKCDKDVIFTAHTYSEQDAMMIDRVSVPVKGALAKQGLEAYFSTIVSVKKMPLDLLEGYSNPMLNVTDDDRLVGYKHVFQTRPTKQTVGERIRGPMDLFSVQETFMDNNAAILLDHMRKFYA